jgi:adenosine deaminase
LARYRKFTSLDDFLHHYFIGMSVLLTSSDFESLATAYFQHAHRDSVHHAEVFFDPQAHTSRGVAYETIIQGFTAAQAKAKTEFGITSELIICVLRHLPLESGMEMYQSSIPYLEDGTIRGLGLSSTELDHPPNDYVEIFSDAEKRGFNLTAHAGEEADVSYMKSAVHDLHVSRVDHGIKLTQDSTVMKEYADKGIMVTMCPLSNVELRCVKSVKELPIRRYLDEGVKFSVNSDDPSYFGGYILDNYCAVQDAFELTKKEWQTIVTNGIRGSWCTEDRKEQLLKALEAVMDQHR